MNLLIPHGFGKEWNSSFVICKLTLITRGFASLCLGVPFECIHTTGPIEWLCDELSGLVTARQITYFSLDSPTNYLFSIENIQVHIIQSLTSIGSFILFFRFTPLEMKSDSFLWSTECPKAKLAHFADWRTTFGTKQSFNKLYTSNPARRLESNPYTNKTKTKY